MKASCVQTTIPKENLVRDDKLSNLIEKIALNHVEWREKICVTDPIWLGHMVLMMMMTLSKELHAIVFNTSLCSKLVL